MAHSLNEEFDLKVRPGDRLRGVWQRCGDIIDRDSARTVARVYGEGPTRAAAADEVLREAHRWLIK